MAQTGVQTTQMSQSTGVDDLIGNKDGSTVRIGFDTLAARVGANLGPTYETLAQINADLGWIEGSLGTVWGDADDANKGVYKKSGLIGAGFWARIQDLPLNALTTEAMTARDQSASSANSSAIEAANSSIAALASGASLFSSTALGIAATNDTDLFYVPEAGILNIYENQSSTAVLQATTPITNRRKVHDPVALKANTTFTYLTGKIDTVAAGDIIESSSDDVRWVVAPAEATDHHLIIDPAGNAVKVYQLLNASGAHSFKAIGAAGDGAANDTTPVETILAQGKKVVTDPTDTFKIGTVGLNVAQHLKDANFVLNGDNAGFDVGSAIDGFIWENVSLTGDGDLASGHKGLTSTSALTNPYFHNVILKGLVQGLDLHGAINARFIGGSVEGAVGEASGEGYGIVAGSSSYGVFSSSLYMYCQRHALYLNNAVYTAVTGNVFANHRDVEEFATGGGLGALQIAGEATAIAENGNVYANNKGPEIVVSPQPTNTKPLECVSLAAGAHYNGQSASIRIGGATPSANERVVGLGVTGKVFMPNIATSGGVIQVYSGFGINISNNTWYLKDGTGTSPAAIALGLTTPNDAHFDHLSICNNNGVFTKATGNAIFISICAALCLGTTRIDIFDNHVETDVFIDYAVTPTNPNIRTDDKAIKYLTLAAGDNDINVAGYNVFSITGHAASSDILNINNGYKGKIIKLLFVDSLVDVQRPNASLKGGVKLTSANKASLILEHNGTNWDELSRSFND